ncbi:MULTISPECIES: helix-turn-helix domain-containing protein [Sphingomonas]|uniref:helix-turn-helix domain-containing protein n=2 Tax=Sphingomonadaceae TaxID=41297 RepID=UPI0034A0B064
MSPPSSGTGPRIVADPEVMTEAQAAAALRVHPKTLARWRRAKLIACDLSPGGRVRYQWGDLLAFRRSMRSPANAPICSHMSGEARDGIA